MMQDLISRQAAIDTARKAKDKSEAHRMLVQLPSAQLAQDLPNGCTDTISRQAAIDAIDRLDIPEDMCVFEILSHIELEIGNLPSAQVERKKGKWIKLDMHAHLADHKCTACGQECYVPTCMGEPMYAYCPNCGADMRGEQDE